MDEYDMVIIGSGPAGLTAAIYSGRQNFKTLVLEKALAGGTGLIVPLMENYPGFDMISGRKLIELMKIQTMKHAEIKEFEEVKKVEYNGDLLKISTTKASYMSKSVILATGSKHRFLNVPGEAEFLGRGVSYCATCDGPLFVGRRVLVVGGGNSAAQQAIYLDSIGVLVAMVHRRDELRAEIYLQKLLEDKDIPIIWNSELEKIKGDQLVQSAVLYNIKTDQKEEVITNGVFIAVGEIPANQVAKEMGVEIDERGGYIITDKGQRTNLPMVYAAGDITIGNNQWLIACSEGAVAALSAYNDIRIKK
jgi:thioredoxin reductase (NADPH)